MTELEVLGVVFETKLLLESYIRLIGAFVSSSFGILRKTFCIFGDPVLDLRRLLLSVLEHCSHVWMSSAASHANLLDCVVSKAMRH